MAEIHERNGRKMSAMNVCGGWERIFLVAAVSAQFREANRKHGAVKIYRRRGTNNGSPRDGVVTTRRDCRNGSKVFSGRDIR